MICSCKFRVCAIKTSRHHFSEAHTRQWGVKCNEDHHPWWIQYETGIGTTRLSSSQCSRGSYSKLQGTFSQYIGGYRNQLSTTVMVPIATKIRGNSQSSTKIQCHTQCVGIRTPQWAIRLKQDSPGTNGMQVPSTWEDRQARHVGIPFSRRMVYGHITRTLLHTFIPH